MERRAGRRAGQTGPAGRSHGRGVTGAACSGEAALADVGSDLYADVLLFGQDSLSS